MADFYYNGNGGLDWGTAGSWNGGVPTANGRAVIPAGAPAITSFSAGQNIDLGCVLIEKGHTGNIGGPANFLTLSCTTASSQEGRVEHRGSGTLYFKDGSTGPTAEVLIDAASGELDAAHLDGSTITRLVVRRGRVTAESTMAAPTHTEIGSRGSFADATLTIADTATTWTNIRINGGRLICGAPTSILVVGGNSDVVIGTGAGTQTAVFQFGGRVTLNNSGTVATSYYLMGGTLDLTNNQYFKTITSLFWMPGATCLFNKAKHVASNSTSGSFGAYYGQSEI